MEAKLKIYIIQLFGTLSIKIMASVVEPHGFFLTLKNCLTFLSNLKDIDFRTNSRSTNTCLIMWDNLWAID